MLIKVKVFPGSKNQKIIKKSEDNFEIKVKAEPQKGKANQETFKIIADYFKIPQSQIKLIKGAKGRNKVFEIKNLIL